MEDSTKTLTVWKQTLTEPHIIEFKGEQNLLDLLRASKISISESCGGFGTCTTCRIIIQTNQAIPSLKEHYFIDQFIIDESEPLRSFKYQYTFAGEEVLDHPPIDINLLGGNSDYLLLNNCKMK